MARVPPFIAAILAVVVLGVPTPASSVVRAAAPPGGADIVPGSVGRSSLELAATYRANLKLTWASRAVWVDSTATIRNTSGGPIDRIELNTIAARLGEIRLRPVTVDGAAVSATVSDQTIVVPLGGVLPAGGETQVRVRFSARLRTGLAGSDWLFTRVNGIVDLYRWLPWVSRRIAFARPNHGDPFETPASSSVRVKVVTDRRLVLATTGDRVSTSSDGLTQVFEAEHVRDFTVTAATDFRTASRAVGKTTVRAWFRPGTDGAALLDAAADAFAALQRRLGPFGHDTFKVVQSAGGLGMESPGLIWIPTGTTADLRYLVAHETAHQWFYGIVGNDQATEPFADEAAADVVARSVVGGYRASRCPAGRLDGTVYDYSEHCYYETIYIQGGNLLDEARRRMGSTAFWAALRDYVSGNRDRIATTAMLLRALDEATPIDLGATLFARWFPRLY